MSNNVRKSSASKIKIDTYDDLFGNDTVEDSSLEQIISVPLTDLYTFNDHPFRVVDDEKMEELVDSIRQQGILSPVLVRPDDEGGYEMISGHRRLHAATIVGLKKIPAIVKELTDKYPL